MKGQLDLFLSESCYSTPQLKMIKSAVSKRVSHFKSRVNVQTNNVGTSKVTAYQTLEKLQAQQKNYEILLKKLSAIDFHDIKFRDIFDDAELELIFEAIKALTFNLTTKKMKEGITATEQQVKYEELLSFFGQNEMC